MFDCGHKTHVLHQHTQSVDEALHNPILLAELFFWFLSKDQFFCLFFQKYIFFNTGIIDA